jgi:cysteine desulfurase NifS/selenium donor protein
MPIFEIKNTSLDRPIYLDYNATTPVHPEVLDAMLPFFTDAFGNPSSNHPYGAEAKRAVETARTQVASLLGCKPWEIIFTSGGSESNNLAIKGLAHHSRERGNHIITSSIEHPAVTEVCHYLEQEGFEITLLPVDRFGKVSVEELEKALRPDTVLITIMHANNEIGTIQPIREIAGLARQHGVAFHTDAAQSAGKVPVDHLGADMVSVAGHKLYAPKGIGALYIRDGISLEKLIHGADHEHNLRAGTENVAFIAGLGKACEIALRDLEENALHARKMRDRLQDSIMQSIPEAVVNGHPTDRLPNTLSISFPGVDANLILSEISGTVAASAGAACHAGGTDISATLSAISLPFDIARGTIRFSTGRSTTEEEINRAAEIVVGVYYRLVGGQRLASASPSPPLTPQPPIPPLLEERGPGGEAKRWPGVEVCLTQYTAGLGCACKLRPQVLEQVLKSLPPVFHPDILVGTESSDDAAVYRINDEQAVVQTLDFFTPIVDDPYTFGAIAAANALSDIYAMGAKPLFALNIVAFPTNRLPLEVLEQILKGAADKAAEAGVHILGGHTIEDPEPKFGMAVTGIVHPDKILRNKGAKPGDALILTKPLGTGILATAMKRGMGGEVDFISSMLTLNKSAAEVMREFEVHACTDITGFGLLGHLHEMTSASGVDVEINHAAVPVLPGTFEMTSAGAIPGGTLNNKDFTGRYLIFGEHVSEWMKIILNDAQTSGGLLIAVPGNLADQMLEKFSSAGVQGCLIGNISSYGSGKIMVI